MLICPALANTTKVRSLSTSGAHTAHQAIDHPTIFAPYLASPESTTLDGIGRGDPTETNSEWRTWLIRQRSHSDDSVARTMAQGWEGYARAQVCNGQCRCPLLAHLRITAAWTRASSGGPTNKSLESLALSSSSAGRSTLPTSPTSPSCSAPSCPVLTQTTPCCHPASTSPCMYLCGVASASS